MWSRGRIAGQVPAGSAGLREDQESRRDGRFLCHCDLSQPVSRELPGSTFRIMTVMWLSEGWHCLVPSSPAVFKDPRVSKRAAGLTSKETGCWHSELESYSFHSPNALPRMFKDVGVSVHVFITKLFV